MIDEKYWIEVTCPLLTEEQAQKWKGRLEEAGFEVKIELDESANFVVWRKKKKGEYFDD